MSIKLRISSRDGRAIAAAMPYALIDRESNGLVSTHSSHAAAMRAMVTLTQVGSGYTGGGFSPEELREITVNVCERMYPTKDVDQLFGSQQAALIRAVQIELRQRGR